MQFTNYSRNCEWQKYGIIFFVALTTSKQNRVQETGKRFYPYGRCSLRLTKRTGPALFRLSLGPVVSPWLVNAVLLGKRWLC